MQKVYFICSKLKPASDQYYTLHTTCLVQIVQLGVGHNLMPQCWNFRHFFLSPLLYNLRRYDHKRVLPVFLHYLHSSISTVKINRSTHHFIHLESLQTISFVSYFIYRTSKTVCKIKCHKDTCNMVEKIKQRHLV